MKALMKDFDDYLSIDFKNGVRENILVKDLLNKIYDDYNVDLDDENISFIIRTKCKNEIINIDINKTLRVFSNMISNSVRYLNGNNKTIAISAKVKNNKVVFKVADNGIGVPNDKLEKIFEPLYTSDPSRKISGLGLSICKEIIESYGGSISAKNNCKGGLTIIFDIPLVEE